MHSNGVKVIYLSNVLFFFTTNNILKCPPPSRVWCMTVSGEFISENSILSVFPLWWLIIFTMIPSIITKVGTIMYIVIIIIIFIILIAIMPIITIMPINTVLVWYIIVVLPQITVTTIIWIMKIIIVVVPCLSFSISPWWVTWGKVRRLCSMSVVSGMAMVNCFKIFIARGLPRIGFGMNKSWSAARSHIFFSLFLLSQWRVLTA